MYSYFVGRFYILYSVSNGLKQLKIYCLCSVGICFEEFKGLKADIVGFFLQLYLNFTERKVSYNRTISSYSQAYNFLLFLGLYVISLLTFYHFPGLNFTLLQKVMFPCSYGQSVAMRISGKLSKTWKCVVICIVGHGNFSSLESSSWDKK